MQVININQLPYQQQTEVNKEVKKQIKYENRFYTIFGIIVYLFLSFEIYIWGKAFLTNLNSPADLDVFTRLFGLIMHGFPIAVTIVFLVFFTYIAHGTIKKQKINDFFIVHGYLSNVEMVTHHGRNTSDVKIYYIIDSEIVQMFQGPTKGLKGPNEKTNVYKYYLIRSSDNCIRRDITKIFN